MKQNEKPFFQDTEKDKKTWNINQCQKKLNKKGNSENGFFFDGNKKTEKENFAAVSKSYKKETFFLAQCFTSRNIKIIKKQQKEV